MHGAGWNPGGHKGKLHREMGIPEGEKIPHDRLEAAMHSSDPEKRRDAIRANTMEHWHHHGRGHHAMSHGKREHSGKGY